ncbi:uL30 family ribosomal protein [Candidatus Pacearchaeota archaeon]|nr:uL30 family ribosomal protein [Candidatus Pacearchaeota archaeon]
MILVLRIAGQVKNKKKDNETLKRLKLNKKFTCILIKDDDIVRMGMVTAVAHMVAYGKVDDAFIKDLKLARKDNEGIYFLHPPRGGFKKSSKVAAPRGILGQHEDIVKLVGRML